MTLEELLSSLGYNGSPCFLRRGDGRFESEMGCGHIFRRAREPKDVENPKRAPRWQAEGVYGIRESADPTSRFTPVVYICSAKDESAAAELHRLLWNQDVAPYIIVHTTAGQRVYSGFNYSPRAKKQEETGVLQELTAFNTAKSIVRQFRAREIDEGRLWRQSHLRIDPSRRVYHRLLSSLRELDKTLQKGGDGLSKEVSHALIGKFVYLRYLKDRGILSDGRLALWDLNAEDIFSPKAKKGSLEKLSENLDGWLNGEIFPLPWRGEHSPSVAQIQAVAGAFCGDEHSTDGIQLHLGFEAYDFSFIPIETLSLVYEQFLHTADPKVKKDAEARKSKGREEGAYYTPLPLVNFMLAGLERQRPLERGMKIFDPSSGSGSFLVQAYRLLIEKTFPGTGPKPKPTELRALLEESIFGCDVDGDACQVTQLSLLLTLLDYVDPPDLTGSMHNFKLPTLCETKDPKKLDAGHTPNILKHNFFGVASKLAGAVARKQGASLNWTKQGFDWIVGNPPWKPISPKKLGENDAPVWQWIKDNEKTKPIGLNQAAQAFAWEAPLYLKSDGECALLVPAMGLFEEPSADFRRNFFKAFQVHEVANFANLAEVLFDGRARVPAAAISYRHRAVDEAINPHELITVFSPFVVNQEATRPLAEGERGKIWSLSINASEVRSLEQGEVASGSGLPWKLAMWGSSWDERLLKRLEKKWPALGKLEARWDRKNKRFIAEDPTQVIGVSEGLQLRKEPEKNNENQEWPEGEEPKPIKEASGAKALDTEALDRVRHVFAFPEAATPKLEKRDWYGREGRVELPLAVCRSPHVIVGENRTFAVYSNEFIVVPPRQIGIVSISSDEVFLKALSLYLSSDFVFYHQLFHASHFGIKRPIATLKALRKLPLPLVNLSRTELKEWVSLHSRLVTCKPRSLATTKKKPEQAQGDFFEQPEDDLDALLAQLNEMTSNILGLSEEERCLVYDLAQVRYALDDGKRGNAAMRVPDGDELELYARTLKNELDDFAGDFAGRSHKVTVVADGESAMIEVDFTTDHDSACLPSICSASDAEAKALTQTRNRLLKDEGAWQWVYFDRNLRIYRGRKTYVFKPLNRFHWTVSAALTDASQIIAETLSGS